MASASLRAESALFNGATAPAILLHTAATPIGRILARFERDQLESFVAVAIDLLDAIDGDPEAEDGDEDRCAAYDDHVGRSLAGLSFDYGPGDPADGEEEPGIVAAYGTDQSLGPIGETEADQLARWEALPRG